MKRDLVIIGGGSAGMACSLGAKSQGLKDVLIIESQESLGGVLNQCIHSGFGFDYYGEDLTGPEFADRMIAELESQEVDFKLRSTVSNISKDYIEYSMASGRERIYYKSLVLATGAMEKPLNSLNISSHNPRGIFSAGSMQKLINIYGLRPCKKAIIVGSGDIGLIMARRMVLSGIELVAIVENQGKISGRPRNFKLCVEDFNIPVYLNSEIERILGKDRVEGLVLLRNSERISLEADSIVYSIGLRPDRRLDPKLENSLVCGNARTIYHTVDYLAKDAYQVGQDIGRKLGGKNG